MYNKILSSSQLCQVVQVNHHFFASIIRTLMTEMELFFEMMVYMNTIEIPVVFFNETQYYLHYPTVSSLFHPDMLLFLSFLHYTCKIKFYKLVYKETFIFQNIFQHSSYKLNNISNELYNIRVLGNGTQTRSEMLVSLCQLTWHHINKDLSFINTTARTSDLTQLLLGSFKYYAWAFHLDFIIKYCVIWPLKLPIYN